MRAKQILRKTILGGAVLGASLMLSQKQAQAKMFFGLFGKSEKSSDSKTDTFIWGNGVRTNKSEYLGTYPQYEPVLIENFNGKKQPFMKTIAFGPGVEVGIDFNGDVYFWPMQKQLSLDSVSYDRFKNRQPLTKLTNKAVSVGFSDNALFVLSKDGSVKKFPIEMKYEKGKTLPSGKKISQKGHSISGQNIVQLAFGENHVLALDKEGLVYCYGEDTLGQCGQGAQERTTYGPFQEKKLDKFEKVQGLSQKIVKIAAGSNHSIAIDEQGKAFGWGNNAFYQLSHAEEYQRFKDPLMVSFKPLPLNKGSLRL